MHNYKELNIWKRAMKLAVDVYRVSSTFPSDERFGLTSQIRRAAVSIASNIAEGSGRNTDGEFIQFLGIANGSSFELTTQLMIAVELEIANSDSADKILKELDETQKMLYAFLNKLKTSK
ncbi:MAG: four helix bundle protein [Bacteroidetes bacterium]|nr:four helix bundle protein [Bacteroidota bacterium]